MNKIIIAGDKNITLDKDAVLNIDNNSRLILVIKNSLSITFNVNSNADIYIYNVDKSIDIVVNMDKENTICNLYYSDINYTDNKYKISAIHNNSNTCVNQYNHGVNMTDKKLVFDISSKVLKKCSGCITNQDNRIININDGKSTIYPILLIDNYDVSSSHSAYIGKFSDDILFYMASRGIDKEHAYQLLLNGFLVYDDTSYINDFLNELSKI